MNKRRIGNDFFVTWEIKDQGELVDLIAVKDSIELYCQVDKHSFKVPQELIEVFQNGVIRVEVKTEVFNNIGRNEFILKYKHFDISMSDSDRKREFDFVPFFLVPKSALADKNVDIAGTSDLLIGLKGDSAFAIWNAKNGNNNTYQNWIDFLQAPATEIEGIVSANEEVRIENENTRISNEQTRVSNENVRVTAENTRITNEGERFDVEIIRDENEVLRIANENQRVVDETKRGQLYDEVVILKDETETATQKAIDTTNKINNVVIPNAELATQNANDAKNDYDTVVKPAVQAQGEYAQEQGDYAKAQGDRLSTYELLTTEAVNNIEYNEITF